jgi:hypothetical protein
MPRRGKFSKPRVMTGTAFTRLSLPSGVLVSMCYCNDPYKVAKSDEEETYKQRYLMCGNYAFDPTPIRSALG